MALIVAWVSCGTHHGERHHPSQLPRWASECSALSILTTSGAISGNGKLTLELLVFHYSNSSGALFFTLLMALPSGRSWSTTLVGRIARIGLAVFPEAAARTKRAGSGNHVVLRLFVEHDEGSAIRRIKRAKPLTSHYLTELVLGVQRKVSGREGRQDRVMGSKRSRRGQPATGGPFPSLQSLDRWRARSNQHPRAVTPWSSGHGRIVPTRGIRVAARSDYRQACADLTESENLSMQRGRPTRRLF